MLKKILYIFPIIMLIKKSNNQQRNIKLNFNFYIIYYSYHAVIGGFRTPFLI